MSAGPAAAPPTPQASPLSSPTGRQSPPPPPAPLIDADSIGFWEATRQGRIALCRCTDCGTWVARPLERCGRCGGPMTFTDVGGGGSVYSFIVVHHPSVPAFAHLVPYVIALVAFDEGPRLPGIVLGADGSDIVIGRRVHARLTRFPGADEDAIAYRLAPTEAGTGTGTI